MSYIVNIKSSNFSIPKDFEELAFESARLTCMEVFSYNDGENDIYRAADKWNSLEDVFNYCGVKVEREANGDCSNPVIENCRRFDNDIFNTICSSFAPYISEDSYIEFEGEEGELWRYSYINKEFKEESGEIVYDEKDKNGLPILTVPEGDVFIISLMATDEYPGGIIGAAYTLENARAIAQASCDMTDGAFNYTITKVSPGKIWIDNQIYSIEVKDNKIISTAIKDAEPIFEDYEAGVTYPEK